MVDPTGISDQEIRSIITQLRANGEIANVAPPQLDLILDRAKKELTEKPSTPPKPPTP